MYSPIILQIIVEFQHLDMDLGLLLVLLKNSVEILA